MNAPLPSRTLTAAESVLAEVPRTAAEHLRLALFGVVAHLIEVCGEGDQAETLTAHPFLADYADAIASRLDDIDWTAAAWRSALMAWEEGRDGSAPAGLPLARLFAAGLTRLDLELLLAVGLPEEDPRFCDLFEQQTGRERRPTAGLLLAWWRLDADGADRVEAVRRAILGLVRTGLIQVLNPQAPRSEWTLAVADPLWDSLRGIVPEAPGLRLLESTALLPLAEYIAPPKVARVCRQLPRLLTDQPAQTLVVRGPRHNGRKTLLGAVARDLHRGLLLADTRVLEDEQRWALLGALAVTLDALPLVELALAPGEDRSLPPLPLYGGPIGVAAGTQGGIQVGEGRTLLTLILPIPDAPDRRLLWQAAAPDQLPQTLDTLAAAARLTSGNCRRAAAGARVLARLEGRREIGLGDVQRACRGLQGARLETLATRIEISGTLADLALDEPTRLELDALAARCRHREALAAQSHDGGATSNGVRALFSGPSGTGKTLAARLLAATLGKDLFRVDLSATVNKYLGETEKNLEQAFGAAEELDVILLLDEGDALMAARTDVGSSNDRYANLETNFLLQRIESFAGILLVTTNAAERIDRAFARRMDVVIPFRAPDEWQRYRILTMHLNAPGLDGDGLVQEIAARCAITGGQIRNIVGHARLLAMQAGVPIAPAHLYASLVREYRKSGAHCPVARPSGVAG
jgi:hypothetical protein